jgi:hypothetical protein
MPCDSLASSIEERWAVPTLRLRKFASKAPLINLSVRWGRRKLLVHDLARGAGLELCRSVILAREIFGALNLDCESGEHTSILRLSRDEVECGPDRGKIASLVSLDNKRGRLYVTPPILKKCRHQLLIFRGILAREVDCQCRSILYRVSPSCFSFCRTLGSAGRTCMNITGCTSANDSLRQAQRPAATASPMWRYQILTTSPATAGATGARVRRRGRLARRGRRGDVGRRSACPSAAGCATGRRAPSPLDATTG